MKLLLAIILSMNLLIGMFLLVHGFRSFFEPPKVSTELKSFAIRVSGENPEVAAALYSFGFEDEGGDITVLIGRVWNLNQPWWHVLIAGLALIVSSMVGLVALEALKAKQQDEELLRKAGGE